jgi:hypothetical protein
LYETGVTGVREVLPSSHIWDVIWQTGMEEIKIEERLLKAERQ